jgi:hypothetical protein
LDSQASVFQNHNYTTYTKTKQNKNCNALNTHSNKIMGIKIDKENGNDIGTNQAPLNLKEEGRLMRTKPKISS